MTADDYQLLAVLPLIGLLGAAIGRLLCRGIDRFPQHARLSEQLRSLRESLPYCSRCEAHPRLVDRLPLIGSGMSRGRCHACRRKLRRDVPVVEAVTAVLFMVFYWREIPSDGLLGSSGLISPEGPPGPEIMTSIWPQAVWLHARYALHMLMVCGLIVATEIDRRLRIIPDGCTIPVMAAAVLASAVGAQLYVVPIWFQDASTVNIVRQAMPQFLQPAFHAWDPKPFIVAWPHVHGLLVSVIGLLVGGAAVWVVRLVGSLALRQEAMGFGDVILMAMVGSVVGWQPALAIFILGAPVLAVFFALGNWLLHNDNEIPYGPFLSAATILLLLTWPWSWPYPKRFLDMGPLLLPMATTAVVSLTALLYLVRFLRNLLSDGGQQDPPGTEWRSADQLIYDNGERPDEQTGLWPRDDWPGTRSGRGQETYRNWRRGH